MPRFFKRRKPKMSDQANNNETFAQEPQEPVETPEPTQEPQPEQEPGQPEAEPTEEPVEEEKPKSDQPVGQACENCSGTGLVDGQTLCTVCDGSGSV